MMRYFCIFWMILLLCACKSAPEVDALLKEAQKIQDEAIHIGLSVDSTIDARMAQGKIVQDIEKLKLLKADYVSWQANMVVIPGLKHTCNHKGHDHGGHEHHHHDDVSSAASQLTPAEMKKVQEEWKSAVVAMQSALK